MNDPNADTRNPYIPRNAEDYDKIIDETTVSLLRRSEAALKAAGLVPEGEKPSAAMLAVALTAIDRSHLVLVNKQAATTTASCPVHGGGGCPPRSPLGPTPGGDA